LAVYVAATLYSTCAAAFLLLIALMAVRGRPSRVGFAIMFCCLVSALWAIAEALPAGIPARIAMLLNSLRLSSWLLLVVALVARRAGREARYFVVGAAALCALALAYDANVLSADPSGYGRFPLQQLFRVALGIVGLLAVENLWRNTQPRLRWHVWPLCLAIGSLYAYNLALFADAFMLRRPADPTLVLGEVIVATFMTPLFALAMARNRDWRIDIHVSRQVVLHTVTLVTSGVFLVVVGFLGMLLRGVGGAWGVPLQLAMLIGSMFGLGIVLSSEGFRRRLKLLISRHFFSSRYDYRREWLNFIDLVSDPQHEDELQVRIIRALAEFVDSPAGVLWSLSRGSGYYPTAAWMMDLPDSAKLPLEDSFLAGFRTGSWVQVVEPDAGDPWPVGSARPWLAVPLAHGSELAGFVVLDRPGHTVKLDWEAFDLLRAAGRQAASYLVEERSTKALLDADLLHNYNKRFAFVVHDIKNLASQLGLIVTNSRRHMDDPEFRRDMLETIEDAVARMNQLLSQLKPNATPRAPPPLNPERVIAEVAAGFPRATVLVDNRIGPGASAPIDAERLKSALSHLVQNAIDASPAGEPVVIRGYSEPGELVIEVVDRGTGMDAGFIRDELFLPFRSTKSAGYGIGAFQTRELVRMSGGDLEVMSKIGEGTTMRVVLPVTADKSRATSSAA
jgi:putative PEP-CTERM system histidine kinase